MRRTGLSHRHPPPAPPKPKSPHSGGGPGCLHLTGSLGESVTLEVRNALQGRSEAVWGNLKALGARPSCPGRHQGACDVLMHQASVSASSEGRPGMVSPGASEAPGGQQRPAGPPPPKPTTLQVSGAGAGLFHFAGGLGEEKASVGGPVSWWREARPASARSSPESPSATRKWASPPSRAQGSC